MISRLRLGKRFSSGQRAVHSFGETNASFTQVLPITSEILIRNGIPSQDFDQCVWISSQSCSETHSSPHRTPADSWCKLRLPFSTSQTLRERFQLFSSGHVRIGKILEVLDSFSAEIAFRHANSFHDSVIVTALLDRMTLDSNDISLFEDLELEGTIMRVGTSSADVRVQLRTHPQNSPPNCRANPNITNILDAEMQPKSQSSQVIGYADFLLVSRDKNTNKAKRLPPLVLVTEEEKRLEREIACARALQKQKSDSIWVKPPDEKESAVLYRQFTSSSSHGCGDEASLGMSQTSLEKTLIMHSQYRNIHRKIFGGHLTREAFEIAWVCALRFGKSLPVLKFIDDIMFLHPVEIGSIMTFKAEVVYLSDRGEAMVNVDAIQRNPQMQEKKLTNEFHFLFSFADKDQNPLPMLNFETYAESMKYVEGRRRYLHNYSE